MKKFLCFSLIVVVALACKKNGPGKEPGLLLSKMFTDGLLEKEYIYSADGKLVRDNTYIIGVGQSTLGIYNTYEYNTDGSLKEVISYSQNNKPTNRRVFTWSAQGTVSRVDEASIFAGDDDLDNMDYFEEYQYDNIGQLTKVLTKRTNQTVVSRFDFSYDDKGNLADWKAWYPEVGWVLKQNMKIVPGIRQMPAHWEKMLVMPHDFDLYTHFIEMQAYTSWFQPGTGAITNYTFPHREYNSQGYLVSETCKEEKDGSTITKERTYEYVQL